MFPVAGQIGLDRGWQSTIRLFAWSIKTNCFCPGWKVGQSTLWRVRSPSNKRKKFGDMYCIVTGAGSHLRCLFHAAVTNKLGIGALEIGREIARRRHVCEQRYGTTVWCGVAQRTYSPTCRPQAGHGNERFWLRKMGARRLYFHRSSVVKYDAAPYKSMRWMLHVLCGITPIDSASA
jgi:hypothetical protein